MSQLPFLSPIVIHPSTLVMRRPECFYCETESANDERTLSDTFGIRYCELHRASAKRDSNAYLHEQKRVKTLDVLEGHPVLSPFLISLQTETTIQRSDGTWDNNWVLQDQCYHRHTTLLKMDGVWHIPMMHKHDDLIKLISLPNFFTEEFVCHNPTRLSSFEQEDLQRVLDVGIYVADYEAVRSLSVMPIDIEETLGVTHVLVGDAVIRAL